MPHSFFITLGSNVKLLSSLGKQETVLEDGRRDGLQRGHFISIDKEQVAKDSSWN